MTFKQWLYQIMYNPNITGKDKKERDIERIQLESRETPGDTEEIERLMKRRQAIIAKFDDMHERLGGRLAAARDPEYGELVEELGKVNKRLYRIGWDPFNNRPIEEAEKAQPKVSTPEMKCTYHPRRDAVGMCVDCGKGACTYCMTTLYDDNCCPSCVEKKLVKPTERVGTPSAEAVLLSHNEEQQTNQKPLSSPHITDEGSNDTEEKQLILTITQTALSASQEIHDGWEESTGHKPTLGADFTITREVSYYFLNMTDRIAFVVGGTKFRDTIMDKIIPITMGTIFQICFKPKPTEAEQEAWLTEATDECVKEYIQAEIDYSGCKPVGGSFASGESPEGKLAQRLSRIPALPEQVPGKVHEQCILGPEQFFKFKLLVARIIAPIDTRMLFEKPLKKIYSLSIE